MKEINTKMKILYDLYFAQPIGSSKFHGGGEYIKTVFQHLVTSFNGANEICVCYDHERFLDDWLKLLIADNDIKAYDVKAASDIPNVLNKNEINVFFTGLAYGYADFKLPENVYRIGTIHGLRSLEKPWDEYAYLYSNINHTRKTKERIKSILNKNGFDYYTQKEVSRYNRVISNFDAIITVSRHSKFAIKCWIDNIAESMIHVYYSPIKYVEMSQIVSDVENIPKKYILMIGGNRWIKNASRSIFSIEQLFSKGELKDYKVVVCGKVPNKIISSIKNPERYLILDYVKPEMLEYLYQHCEFFLYLSLNEGFGIPPLEAMKYGKTVVTSSICSIPEIYGNSVYYANPYDVKEIQNRILQADSIKIDNKIIQDRFELIQAKQKSDLHSLCEFIVSGGTNV